MHTATFLYCALRTVLRHRPAPVLAGESGQPDPESGPKFWGARAGFPHVREFIKIGSNNLNLTTSSSELPIWSSG